MKRPAIHYYGKFTQYYLIGLLNWILFHSLYRIKITGRENLREIKSPVIVIANHIRSYDGLFLRLAFGGRPYMWPLRFMGGTKFLHGPLNLLSRIGVIQFLYKIFAVFVITKGEGIAKNLIPAKQALAEGDHVMIYPEGRIVQDGIIHEFKKGATVLAQETDTAILPVSIRVVNDGRIRGHLYINIGKLRTLDKAQSTETNTRLLQTEVERLFDLI